MMKTATTTKRQRQQQQQQQQSQYMSSSAGVAESVKDQKASAVPLLVCTLSKEFLYKVVSFKKVASFINKEFLYKVASFNQDLFV